MVKTIKESIEAAIIARDEDESFYRALGRFMVAWSDAEAELYRALVQYAGVTDAVARALFSGSRASVMMKFIQAIAHNTKMSADRMADLEHVFPQMSAINTMRDHLAHYASHSYAYPPGNPRRRVVSNSKRTSRYGREFSVEVDAQMMEAMTQDLYAIANHLNMHWGPRTGSFRPWREQNEDDPPTPWLYRSPQPIGNQGKSTADAPKQPRQRPSSRKSS